MHSLHEMPHIRFVHIAARRRSRHGNPACKSRQCDNRHTGILELHTGTLKLLLDRLVYALINTSAPGAMPKQLHHGARLGIICACTAPWPLSLTQTRPTVKALRRIFRLAGYTVYPAISVTGTNNTKPLKPAILKSATVLGSKLSVTCRSRNH